MYSTVWPFGDRHRNALPNHARHVLNPIGSDGLDCARHVANVQSTWRTEDLRDMVHVADDDGDPALVWELTDQLRELDHLFPR